MLNSFLNPNSLNDLFNELYGVSATEYAKKKAAAEATSKTTATDSKATIKPVYYMVQDESEMTTSIELPGCPKEQIDVTVEKNTVTVSATRDIAGLVANYSLQYRVGNSLDAEKMSASYADGLLTIKVPTKQPEEPTKIRLNIL